jgi:predicted Zn-dependent protease
MSAKYVRTGPTRSAKFIHGLVNAENWVRAFPEVAGELNEDPDNPELLYLAGCVMRGLGHVGMALPYFAKALSKQQQQPNLWMHYGATLHDLNEWDDAIKAFEVVHQMLPTDPMPPANIAKGQVDGRDQLGR